MKLWKSEQCTLLSDSYQSWLKRIEYIKDCIRQILYEFDLLTETEQNVQVCQGVKVDFYLSKYKFALKIVDIISCNSTKSFYGIPVIKDNIPFQIMNQVQKETDIRLVNVYQTLFFNENTYKIYRNIISYSCGKSIPIYARNTKVIIGEAKKYKQFFLRNNIAGYRNADKIFGLVDKKTDELLMAYTCGHSFFGKGKYDLQIARGACVTDYHEKGIGVRVIGGASKLWKFILNYYDEVGKIVYYVDRRYYNHKSIHHLMDSNDMKGQGQVKLVCSTKGFMNFWISRDQGQTFLYRQKNRQPMRHGWVMEQMKKGWCLCVPNPGTNTFLFERNKRGNK